MKKKNPLSIRLIYWITQIIFGLVILVSAAVLVINVLLYFPFFGEGLQIHANMPVEVNILETGYLEYKNQIHKAELVNATSQIHLINTPAPIARLLGTAMLIAFLISFYIFFTFRKFIVNVYKEIIFDEANVYHLRNIAYGLLGLWIYALIYSRWFYGYIVSNLSFEQVEISDEYRKFAGILMLALFTWVLSHIFSRGVKLKEEQELTI